MEVGGFQTSAQKCSNPAVGGFWFDTALDRAAYPAGGGGRCRTGDADVWIEYQYTWGKRARAQLFHVKRLGGSRGR
jgi:hypothetical protein